MGAHIFMPEEEKLDLLKRVVHLKNFIAYFPSFELYPCMYILCLQK